MAPSHADPEASIVVLLGSPAATAPRVHRQGRRLAEVYGIPLNQPVWSRRFKYSRNFGAVYSYWPFRVR